MRRLLYSVLIVVFLLHNDWWLWRADGFAVGLPVGLAYHLGYCLAVVALMALLVRYAWPQGLEDDE